MATAAFDLAREAAPLRAVRLGPADCVSEHRPDGTILMRSPHPLAPYPGKLSERLEHWAKVTPERIFLGQRHEGGHWRTLTYAQTLARVHDLAQALLDRQVSPERPIAILSGNDIEHALLGLAATYIGVPYAPISPAYSLLSTDFGKLKHILAALTPGLLFAADGKVFARAIAAALAADVEVVVTANPPADRTATRFADLVQPKTLAQPTAAVAGAHAGVGPDTIAKILFTSGSTGMPKGVINTQRMLCSNQAMAAMAYAFVTD
jgi:feruloyl-CoA synthase